MRLTAKQATRKFLDAIALVKRFGVKVTRQHEFGAELNGEWHAGDGHVCACGALVLALNPSLTEKEKNWSDDETISGVRKILGVSEAEAWAISEGFEGDPLGHQWTANNTKTSTLKKWYAVGKTLRRHGEKVEATW